MKYVKTIKASSITDPMMMTIDGIKKIVDSNYVDGLVNLLKFYGVDTTGFESGSMRIIDMRKAVTKEEVDFIDHMVDEINHWIENKQRLALLEKEERERVEKARIREERWQKMLASSKK